MDDPILREPTHMELIAWVGALFAATGDPQDLVIAKNIARVVQDGAGQFAITEPRQAILVQSLRLVEKDPDLFFVDPDGPFHNAFRGYPARVLRLLGDAAEPDTAWDVAMRAKVHAQLREAADGS